MSLPYSVTQLYVVSGMLYFIINGIYTYGFALL